MAVPAILLRQAPAVASRFTSWLSTSNMGIIRSVKAYLAAHPTASSIVASTGITGLVDLAMSGNPDALSALNDAAAQHGVTLDGDGVVIDGGNGGNGNGGVIDRLFDSASDAVGSLFKDNDTIAMDEKESERIRQERSLVRFLQGEVSGSPEYLIRYHSMMSEFLRMDPSSVKNLVRAYM